MGDPRPENPWLRWGLLAAVMVATGVWWYLDPNPGAPADRGEATVGSNPAVHASPTEPPPPSTVDTDGAFQPATGSNPSRAERRSARLDELKRRYERKRQQRRTGGKEGGEAEPAASSVNVDPSSEPGASQGVGQGRATERRPKSAEAPQAQPPRGPPSASVSGSEGLKTRLDNVRVLNYGKLAFSGTVDLGPTIARIKRGERHSHRNDGSVFGNRERRLPSKRRGYYREFVHPTPGIRGAGPQRLVVGQGGEWFYTPDHYESFTPLGTATWSLPRQGGR